VSAELYITPPMSTSPWVIEEANPDIERQIGFPATLDVALTQFGDLTALENEPSNPGQMRAYIDLVDNGVHEFRGRVHGVTRGISSEGEVLLKLNCFDKMKVLDETYAITYDAANNPQRVWALESPTEEVGNPSARFLIRPGYDYGEGFRFVYWPDPGSPAWLSTGASPSSALGENITDATHPPSGGPLKLGTSHNGLLPKGFLSIDTEWIEYNGLTFDGTNWNAQNIRRGALDTTATSHTMPKTAYCRICKRTDPNTRIVMEGDRSTSQWEVLAYPQSDANIEDGSFPWGQDPLKLRADAVYTHIAATYRCYAEEAAGVWPTGALKLSDVLKMLLIVNPDHGGPGFGFGITQWLPETCQVVVNIEPNIKLARVVCETPMSVMAFIQRLLFEIGLAKGDGVDAISMWYDSATDTMHVESLAQRDLTVEEPHRRYRDAQRRDEDADLSSVGSAVLVSYEQGGAINLLSSDRCWHTPLGDGSEPFGIHIRSGKYHQAHYADAKPGPYNATKCYGTDGAGTTSTTVQLLFDRDGSSAFGLFWTDWPGAGVRLYCWFPGADDTHPDTFFIEGCELTLSVIGTNTNSHPFDVTVYAYEDFLASGAATFPTKSVWLPIAAVNTTLETFAFTGDHHLDYPAGSDFWVLGSTGNDGKWTVASGGASYSSSTGLTTVPVTGNITNPVADGSMAAALVPLFLDAALTQRWANLDSTTEGNLNYETYVLRATNIYRNIKAVGLQFDGLIKNPEAAQQGLTGWGFIVKDFRVWGVQRKQVFVSLSPSYSAGVTDVVVAPQSEAKLRDSTMGQHKCLEPLDIGPATRAVASNLGVLQLLQSLALTQTRNYGVESVALDEAGSPRMGETELMPDGFSGLCDYAHLSYYEGARAVDMRLVNFATTLLGGF